MRLILVILMAVPLRAGVQEESIPRLIKQLAHDDIDVRATAIDRLVQMGDSARKSLVEATKSPDPEVAARARSILGEILLGETRARSLGPAWRVSIPRGEYSLSEIAGIVGKQNPVRVSFPRKLFEERVKIEADGMLFWEFLETLCKVHGGIRLSAEHGDTTVSLEEGIPALRAPVRHSGPFRVWIERMRLERGGPLEQVRNKASMVIALAWQPNVRPIGDFQSSEALHMSNIVGSDGKKLGIEALSWQSDELYSGFTGHYDPGRRYRQFILFEPPRPGMRRLKLVEGYFEVLFPLRFRIARFETPSSAVGRSQKVGSCSITLTAWKPGEKETVAEVRVSLSKDAETYLHDKRVGLSERVYRGDISLVNAAGETLKCSRFPSLSISDPDQEALDLELHFPGTVTKGTLLITVMTEYFERRIEFQFKDVELP